MLKNYSKENYASWKDFQQAVLSEVKSSFEGHDSEYRGFLMTLTDFKFDSITINSISEDVIKVLFEDDTYLLFFRAVKAGILKLNKEDMQAYEKLNAIIDDAKLIHQEELKEAAEVLDVEVKKAREEYLARQEQLAQQAEIRKQEAKYRARVQKQLKKLESLKPENTSRLFEVPTTYYEAIGWMAKHTTSIKASMPDYMEKWFDGRFDCENKNVVNSKKRTVNGNPMQWGLSFRMSFDAEVSGALERKATSKNKKVIDSVAFVWDLIENYGFQFSKTRQDVEKIKAEIPQEHISDFEKGLAM